MLKAIQLVGYRAFPRLSIEGLSRVTLIVGKNNTGKTSILEAAEVLATGGSFMALARVMNRRGEHIPESDASKSGPELDVSHLFHGHTTQPGDEFSIVGRNDATVGLHCSVLAGDALRAEEGGQKMLGLSGDENLDPVNWEDLGDLKPPQALRILNTATRKSATTPLSPLGGLRIHPELRSRLGEDQNPGSPVLVIPTDGMNLRTLGNLWNSIALTPDEAAVIDALRIIEPSITRLAYLQGVVNQQTYRRTEGFFATLEGVASRIPFGSMGDGMKRLLALAMAVSQAAGGFLLVDEIDTGLHYTTMPDMWKLIVQTAQRLNVQVIATTHSGDCVRSLAWLHTNAPELAQDVSLHRIERGLTESVPFSAAELTIGAQQHIEFR